MTISNADLNRSLEQKTNFEELLLDISALFINLPVNRIDAVIENTQRRICQCLDFDLSALWQWSDKNSHILTVTHLYSPAEGPEHPVDIDASQTFPWSLQADACGKNPCNLQRRFAGRGLS